MKLSRKPEPERASRGSRPTSATPWDQNAESRIELRRSRLRKQRSQKARKRPAKPYPVRGRPAWGSGGMEWPAIARVVTAVPTAPACSQASRADGPRDDWR